MKRSLARFGYLLTVISILFSLAASNPYGSGSFTVNSNGRTAWM